MLQGLDAKIEPYISIDRADLHSYQHQRKYVFEMISLMSQVGTG